MERKYRVKQVSSASAIINLVFFFFGFEVTKSKWCGGDIGKQKFI